MILNKRDKQNRMVVLLIFGMTLIPFGLAWFFGGKAPFIKGQINKGQLITPVITTKQDDLIGIDPFSISNMSEIKGKWLVLNVVSGAVCNTSCQEAIHKTRQLHLMMNKDFIRIRRAVVFFKDVNPDALNEWLKDDKILLKVKPGANLSKKISERWGGQIPDGMLLLMDPLGNLMMEYAPGFDPYKVKSDLLHLLRISQIG